jgi:HEAT repeat protein
MYRNCLAGLSVCLLLAGCPKKEPPPPEKPAPTSDGKQGQQDAEPKETLYKGYPLSAWVKKSQDGADKVREEAINALGNFKEESAVKALADRVKDQDAEIRKLAVITLAPFGARAKTAVPNLIGALHDPDVNVVFQAAITLGKIGPGAKEAVPALQEALEGKNQKEPEARTLLRQYAIESLGQIGPEARPVVPKLIELLKKEKKESVREKALIALGKIDPENQKVLAALGEAFRDKNDKVQGEAEAVLVRCGDKAVQTLLKALNDPNSKIGVRAASALASIGPSAKAAVPDLRTTLRHKDAPLRMKARTALEKIAPKEVVPALIEALKDPEPDVRQFAALSVLKYGKEAKAAVPTLLERLADANAEVLDAAAIALREIERGHKDIVPALAQRLKEGRSDARDKAFLRISDFGKPAVAPLVEIVKDALEEDKVASAVAALGRIGKDAKEGAWTEVLALYKNEDTQDAIRGAAREALRKMDPAAAKKEGVK